MHKSISGIAALALAGGLSTTALAQDEPAESYVYATYSVCDLARQDRADAIVDRIVKPVYDAAVADGTITGWGWLAHHTGGKWRRINFHVAPTMEAALAAGAKINPQIDARDKKASDEFAAICSSHDDYVWRRVAGTTGTTSRGKFGFSVYLVCDSTREAQADAIVKSLIAPIQDKLVADGKLTNWGWHEHMIGGQYRRLATTGAVDLNSLMEARAALFEALEDEPLADALYEICDSHQDYIWEIRHQSM